MSTTIDPPGAETTTEPTASAGRTSFQRKRRRRVVAGGATVVIAVVAVVLGLTLPGGGGGLPGFTVAYGQGNVATPDSIIQTQPDLVGSLPGKVKYVPFDAGVTAIAELRSGSLQAISGVGNPPVVAGIANGTDVTVVLAQSFDADALIVPADVTDPSQLSGTSVGVLTGSSEDYELRGWLALNHLTDAVKVVGLSSEQAVAAAYLAGTLQGAYVQAGPEAQLVAKGGHAITDAQKIADLGIPGLNVVAVASATVAKHPELVQKYVCAQVAATKDLTGPNADTFLAQSASAQGVPANLIGPATKAYPFITLDQQVHWLGTGKGDATSQIVSAYYQTGQWLLTQGRVSAVPTKEVLANHVDSSFVQKALAGGC